MYILGCHEEASEHFHYVDFMVYSNSIYDFIIDIDIFLKKAALRAALTSLLRDNTIGGYEFTIDNYYYFMFCFCYCMDSERTISDAVSYICLINSRLNDCVAIAIVFRLTIHVDY